jgi:hypothetical protein
MKSYLLIAALLIVVTGCFSQDKKKPAPKEKRPMQKVIAQKQTFDLATYTSPKGWKKETTEAAVQFVHQDSTRGTYCIIMLLKSLPGTPVSIDNFNNAWETVVKEIVTPSSNPEMQPSAIENGWELQTGTAPFDKDGEKGAVLLITATASEKMVNAIILTNSDAYEKNISEFLGSISLKKPTISSQGTTEKTQPVNAEKEVNAAVSKGFTFTTTNFDDGWTSVEKADWIEVTKGESKVLLHYPTDGIKAANTDVPVMCSAAWNYLVAPRYQTIQDYKVGPGMLDYERPYYAEATLTDKSGATVFVVLFKKATGWMEFITPNRKTFIETFGVDISKLDYYADSQVWDQMKRMANYNKFAIGAADFAGKWNSNFSNNTYYVNAYTGVSAGMSTYSSSQVYEFFPGSKYKWNLVAANSSGGASQFAGAKGAGTFKVVNNWQIYFSDIEGKPKTYDAYFSCIKGARMLWIDGSAYGRE